MRTCPSFTSFPDLFYKIQFHEYVMSLYGISDSVSRTLRQGSISAALVNTVQKYNKMKSIFADSRRRPVIMSAKHTTPMPELYAIASEMTQCMVAAGISLRVAAAADAIIEAVNESHIFRLISHR